MSFSGPMEDRLAIRELYGAYADSAFLADRNAWLDCWADDCVWWTEFGESIGKPALDEQWDVIWQTFRSMGFFSEIGSIVVDGDKAKGRAYCREILNLGEGRIRKLVGAYYDDLVRENGRWRFARRNYTVMIAEEPPAS
jgi:ketosteroid isomerase-like protein